MIEGVVSQRVSFVAVFKANQIHTQREKGRQIQTEKERERESKNETDTEKRKTNEKTSDRQKEKNKRETKRERKKGEGGRASFLTNDALASSFALPLILSIILLSDNSTGSGSIKRLMLDTVSTMRIFSTIDETCNCFSVVLFEVLPLTP